MDWMYALAGGAFAGGDAYSKEQAAQRDWRRKQSEADAEYARKENFARFGVQIDQQKDQNRSQTALQEHKDKSDYDRQYEMSGLYDPKTKRELTKKELEDRGSAEGLVPKADFEQQEKDRLGQESRDRNISAEEARIIKAYGEGSKQHKDWKGKALGVPKEDTRGDRTEASVIKDEADLRKSKNKYKDELKETVGQTAASALGTLRAFREAPADVQKIWAKANEKELRKAMAMEKLAQSPELQGKSPAEAKKALKTQYPNMSDRDVQAVLDIAEQNEVLGEAGWIESVKSKFGME